MASEINKNIQAGENFKIDTNRQCRTHTTYILYCQSASVHIDRAHFKEYIVLTRIKISRKNAIMKKINPFRLTVNVADFYIARIYVLRLALNSR